MKTRLMLLVFVLAIVVVVFSVAPALAQGNTQPVEDSPGFGSLVWTFLNSPVGVSLVGIIAAVILGKGLTAKPAWRRYAEQYRPLLIQAVKEAEKLIPDDGKNPGLRRMDSALKYMLMINSALDPTTLVEALSAIHSELEAGGGLTKPKE